MPRSMRRIAPTPLAAAVVALALVLSGCTPAPTTTAVTVPGSSTSAPAESVDGRWTAFLAGDDANASDLYVYDRTTASSTFIAHGAAAPSISGDGRYVAFTSSADLLGTGPHHRDVFVWDRTTHGLSQVTHGNADSGVDDGAGDLDHRPQAISADGRILAFTTQATDLVPGGNIAGSMVSVDRSTGAVTLERPGNPGRPALDPALSADGRYLSFVQDFVQWPDGPATGTRVHRRDRATGTDVDIDLALSATSPPTATASPTTNP